MRISDWSSDVCSSDLDNLYSLHSTFADDPALRTKIAAYASTRLEPALRRLGFKPVAGESSEDAILRTDLITYLGAMGDRTVLAAAQERFAKPDHDPAALTGPLQTAWLGGIARHASKAECGKLGQRSEESREGKEGGGT